jgi:hypothetical protein
MTDYTRREVSVTRVEYYVPAPAEGCGYAYWAPLRDAILAIEQELGEAARYDDAVRIEARDDEIVLSYPKPASLLAAKDGDH